jgi:hypothetical protein
VCAGKADLDPKPPEIAGDVIRRRGDDTEKNKKPVSTPPPPPLPPLTPIAQVSDKSQRTDSELELHFRHSLLNFEVNERVAVAAPNRISVTTRLGKGLQDDNRQAARWRVSGRGQQRP